MADRTLTDDELLSIFQDDRADLSLLSREERARLVRLTGPIPASEQPPLPEGPTTGGMLRNAMSSAMQFGRDMIGGVRQGLALSSQPIEQQIETRLKSPSPMSNLMSHLGERYGSYDDTLQTLYQDPVGAASDASLAMGGASYAARIASLQRVADALRLGSAATNPLGVPAQLAETGGRALYRASINPSRRIQRGFPGAVEAGYERNVLPTTGGLARTEQALETSAARTQQLLTEADQAGAAVNMRRDVVGSLRDPARRAGERYALGKPDERPDVSARARALARRNPGDIPLTQANKLKQEAQRLADSAFRAEERGAIIKDLEALSDERVAQALRRAIEVQADRVGVSGVGASNAQTQALIGLAQALEDVTQQPSRLTNLIGAATAGGSAAAGGPLVGAVAGTGYKMMTSRPGQATTGLGLGKVVAPVSRKAQVLRALMVLQSLGSEPEQ
jgi:hypothetical protein